MSVPEFPTNDPSLTRDAVINQLISSIAMEELGLSHIINAEGEKLQYALGTIPGSTGLSEPLTVNDLLELNKSIHKTLDSTMQNQIFLKDKLEAALCASKTACLPFLSSYIEVLGDTQTVASGANIIFDIESDDNVGNNFVLDQSGTVLTINRPGLYQIEWTLNLASSMSMDEPVVVGIIENGEGASGASTSSTGNFSSGTLIEVDTVPFTISLHNYGREFSIESHPLFEDSAASIRILRFADGASN